MQTDPRAIRKYYFGLSILVALILVLIGVSFVQSRGKAKDSKVAERLNDAWYDIESKTYSLKRVPISLKEATNKDTEGLTYYRLSSDMYMLCVEFKTNSGEKPGRLSDREKQLVRQVGPPEGTTTYYSSTSDKYGYVNTYDRQEGRNCYIKEAEVPDNILNTDPSQSDLPALNYN